MRKATIILLLLLLKARYTPAAGSDPEYGQGAIERNDLRHREVQENVWLIAVEDGDAAEWQRRLNETAKHGRFTVECATAEEEQALRDGLITLQR